MTAPRSTSVRLIAPSRELVELAEVIGQEAVRRLCETIGGGKVYVPRVIPRGHPIDAALSPAIAAKLAEHYHGTFLELPKAYIRRERAIEMARSGDMTVREAAQAADYSERHLRRLLNGGDDEDQLALPF